VRLGRGFSAYRSGCLKSFLGNVTEALESLTTRFTAKDIMTSKSQLVCALDSEAAPEVSAANPDFSVIPIKKDNQLTAYFERDARRTRPIEVADLVSDGTTLIDMVDILQRRGFSFVLTGQHISGYIHYSDLNHQLVKWTFYVMLEAVERLTLEALQPADERAYMREKLGPDRFKQIEGMYKRAGDNGRNLMTYLNVADILRMAVSDGLLQLEETSIKMMKQIRDWSAHVLYDLPDETAVGTLATAKRECLRLLDGMSRAAGASPSLT
jgi:hypothetical protein